MRFQEIIERSLTRALESAGFPEGEVKMILEKPRLKEHGDICTPIALSLAKVLKRNPLEIAELIARAASFPDDMVASVEIAKPGYINLKLAHAALVRNLRDVDKYGDDYGSSDIGGGRKCQVEYVSANPTGPLVVVSARAAAVGSVIVNLLRNVGFDAEGEYYVNDYGNQIEALGKSLRFRVRERLGLLESEEEIGAYPAGYVTELAAGISAEQAARWDERDGESCTSYGSYATEAILRTIEEDLEFFGVRFDNFFRESCLHPALVAEALKIVEDKGFAYTREGAVHFETTRFGDEKDRVLVKSDGNPTYFLGDIAYHLTKLRRGYEWVIDLLGPDHHGHIPRMKAAASVLGAHERWFEALVVGWVRLMEGKKPISMSKRAGEFITMRELIEDVGTDVAKYFFLMRRTNSPLDFDLQLARKQSDENPVFYVQYAHARIASVTRFAEEKGAVRDRKDTDLSVLSAAEERELMVHLMFYPYVVEGAALSREPHRLTSYAKELATLFHQFYHKHRIVTDDAQLSSARLTLAVATMQVLRNTLCLLGVDAPKSM
ncbi:MAG: arginine--tRNA ligase [Candidatus Latescibacterota bacterium]|nr:MAG: arginine--tRNA ligase [Candidatus Latescibacterota bacterium]